MNEAKEKVIKFFDWVWNSNSGWSYLVLFVLLFIFIKFLFLPGLGLIFGQGFSMNSLPLAIVESSSMDHNSVKSGNSYTICDKTFTESKFFNLENYWDTCGDWYEERNLSKEEFKKFPLKNGFRKGDLVVIFGKKHPKIGDVLVFRANRNHPIIHRVISLEPIQTKGDHNNGQLNPNNNIPGTDETNIKEEQLIGVAVMKIPYLGWLKLGFVELLNMF